MNRIPARLSRAEQRQLRALGRAHESVLAADRAFFERHPGRTHRLRRMSAPEIEVSLILRGPGSVRPPEGYVLFVAVKRITPGLRVRAFGAIIPHGGDDPSEAIGRACFETWTDDWQALRDLEERFADLHAQGKLP